MFTALRDPFDRALAILTQAAAECARHWQERSGRGTQEMSLEEAEIEEAVFAPDAANLDQEICICPVTRQTLRPGTLVFRCRQCQMRYSREGWDFLKQTDRGRCCGCGNRNTVTSFVIPR